MKKFFFTCALLVSTLMLNAKQVVFDFSDATTFGFANPAAGASTDLTSGAILSQDGITMSISFTSGNGFRFFSNSNTSVVNLRGYVGASFEIKAPEGYLLYSVEWTGTNLGTSYVSGDINNGKWSSDEGATKISGSIIKSTVQINTMVVVIEEEGKTPDVVLPDTLTCADARKRLEAGEKFPNAVVVYGYVTELVEAYNPQYGNTTFWMADTKDGGQVLEGYRVKPVETADQDVKVGDYVKVEGTIVLYGSTNPTPEFNAGALYTIVPEPAEPAPLADEIIFTEVASAGDLKDVTYAAKGMTLTTVDPDGKISIDANNAYFGTAADYTLYAYRMKTGGKSNSELTPSKNYLKVNVENDGFLRVAVRTGSNSDATRTLVAVQNGEKVFEKKCDETLAVAVDMGGENAQNVYPYFYIPVKAGEVTLSYPVNGINFYSFAWVAEEPATPEQPIVGALKGAYNIGGEKAHFASLSEAVTYMENNGVEGDVTFLICADLTENTNIGLTNNTDYTITIAPDAAVKRTITFGDQADNAGPSGHLVIGTTMAIGFNTTLPTKNIVIDGSFDGEGQYLEFVGGAVGGNVVVVYGNVTETTIKNCRLIHPRTTGTNYAVHFRAENGNDNTPVGVVVENCYLQVTGSANAQVVYFNGSQSKTAAGKPTDCVLRNNEIVSNLRGIFFNGANNAVIEGNTFRFPAASPGFLAHGIMGNAQSGKIIVRGNKFIELGTTNTAEGDFGIQAITASGGAEVWVIENNYFAGLDALNAAAADKAIKLAYVRCGDSCVVRHNTFYMPVLTHKPTTALMSATPISCLYLAGSKKYPVENNIIVCDETEANVSLIRGTLNANCKNNVFYHNGGNTAIVAGGVVAMDWDTFTADGANAGSVWAKPNFVDAANGNLDLVEADEDMLMPRLAEVLTDIYGTERAAMTCAGAFESTNIIEKPFDPEELFDPALASTSDNYFAPNWNPDGVSSATYENGVLSVDLKSNFYGQWQAQVKLNHNVEFSAEYQYVLSCKFHATAAVNGVTIKLDDNTGMIYENQTVNLPANEDYVYTSVAANGIEGNNKILVFDFGYAAPCQITISEISIKKVGKAVAPPAVEHPEAAPAPTRAANNVFSIYSDVYTTTVTRAMGGWGQQTIEQEVELAEGDHAMYYTTANYLGWELNGNNTIGDMTAYPNLHMDIYVAEAGTIKFTPIWGAEAGKEYSLIAGWNQIDIVLATDFAGINLANIYQLKWDAMPQTCYIDNVYFYNEDNQGGGEGTGLDNVNSNVEVKKVMIDGQVYIIRDGVRYNVMGMQVR